MKGLTEIRKSKTLKKNKGGWLLILILLSLGVPLRGMGQQDPPNTLYEMRDPFHFPNKKVLSRPARGGVRVDRWQLTGILVGDSGEKLAIINNRLVTEGESVTGGVVHQIFTDRVILKGAFGKKELRILPFFVENN